MLKKTVVAFYEDARAFCYRNGYRDEIEVVRNRQFRDQTPKTFLIEYVYVVLNAGMKNQVAEQIFGNFMRNDMDPGQINHEGKRKAIEQALEESEKWFSGLHAAHDKLGYIGTLPWMGDITKYHLARNLGLDYAKPDRHLVRVAKVFGFKEVQLMCRHISSETRDPVGVVDVVIWRYCNLTGGLGADDQEYYEMVHLCNNCQRNSDHDDDCPDKDDPVGGHVEECDYYKVLPKDQQQDVVIHRGFRGKED